MNGLEPVAKLMVAMGVVLVLLGGVVWLLSRSTLFGQLPGYIRIERDGVTCFVPLASSIILSLLLTIVLNVIVRLINR
ncbi:MAG: DUF2905 domain-containing protein [Chloroflexota bacterium]